MPISENQLQNTFKGFSINDDQFDYHVIVCDNPYMAELGMAAFTTGQLYNWITKTDAASGLVNLKIIGLEKDLKDLDSILIKQACNKLLGQRNGSGLNFSTFRKTGRGGEYQKFENEDWTYNDFSFSTLSFQDFDDAIVNIPKEEDFDLTYKSNPSGVDKRVSNIIEMNNYVRYKSVTLPKNEWDDQSLARYYFIEDIKASKERCIQWSGVIPFTLNIGVPTTEGSNSCIKEVPVNYKLFLFDEKNPLENSRKISFNDLTIVSPKIDVFGRQGFKEDGELNSVSRNINPKDNVASKLSLNWNELDGKWESGTFQILGIMSTDIEAAEVPELQDIKNLSVVNLLDPNTQLKVIVGSAIPLLMQNGNPLQYSPDYKLSKDARLENEEKVQIRVYNRAPVAFSSGDVVILSKIDGTWQPSLIGEPKVIKKILPRLPQKWGDVSYFMTNVNHFYIKKDGTRFDYQDFESSFRSGFYYDNDSVSEDEKQDSIIPNKWKDLDITNTVDGINYGHLQVTSFDFMSDKIGGMKSTNSIGNTNIDFDSSSNPYPRSWGSDVRISASSTAPFFGCIFPDGYNDTKIIDYLLSQHSGSLLGVETELPSDKKNILQTTYLTKISKASPIFDNSVNSNRYSEGIFSKDQNSNLKDLSLSHLPVDIGLNASPEGAYGSPITIYGDAPFFPKERPDIYKLQSKLWHHDASGDFYKSFFDFEPVNPNRIQFRPLKAETYAFAEFKDRYSAKSYFDNEAQSRPQYAKLNRGVFGMQSRESQKDFNSILTDEQTVLLRYWGLTRSPYLSFDNMRGLIGVSGLRYNPDFVGDSPVTLNPAYNNNTNGNNYHPLIWGNTSRAWTLNPDRGAGGLGVIGAKYTVYAENSIKFDTESLLGQPAWIQMAGIAPNNNLIALPIGGGLFMGGVGGGWIDRRLNQVWGKCEFYYDLNTTGLFVRIFSAWPKEQTYFDPRYFSVLHFNPIDKQMKFAITKYWYKNGELRTDIPITDKPPNNEEEQYPNGWYKVDQQSTSVDVRVPTWTDGFDFTNSDIPVTKGILREIKDWNINNSRRGKLLPYKKKFPAIGIGKPNSEFQSLFIDVNQLSSVPNNAKLTDYDCLIFNKGTGYTANDTFTVPNSDGAILKPIIAAGGQITGFTVQNSGKNLPSKLFANKDEKIVIDQTLNPNYKNLHKVVSLKLDSLSKGKGLEAYIPRGWLTKYLIEDKKPTEVLDAPLKLTPDPDSAEKIEVTYEASRINEVQVQKILADGTVESFSENNQYDLFFHFHNDISHTLTDISRLGLAGKWGGEVAYENAVTLTINTE
jgi:hypothetical protein